MLKQVLLRARHAGLRVHRGAVIGPGDGDAIVDRDSYDRLVATLTDRGRRTNSGAPRSKHLLGGIARCGACDGPMPVLVDAYLCPLLQGPT